MELLNLKDIINKNIELYESKDFLLIGIDSAEVEIVFDLKVQGITVNIYGLVLLKDSQKLELKTKTIHSVPNSNSWVLIKGIFEDKSMFNFEGMISIHKGAFGSDAYLQNDNLILSNESIVNSSPQLEIANDDVKASHGVTLSTIDDLQKFYLTSRGLDSKISDSLMIKGFASEVVDKIKDVPLLEKINEFFKNYDK